MLASPGSVTFLRMVGGRLHREHGSKAQDEPQLQEGASHTSALTEAVGQEQVSGGARCFPKSYDCLFGSGNQPHSPTLTKMTHRAT